MSRDPENVYECHLKNMVGLENDQFPFEIGTFLGDIRLFSGAPGSLYGSTTRGKIQNVDRKEERGQNRENFTWMPKIQEQVQHICHIVFTNQKNHPQTHD